MRGADLLDNVKNPRLEKPFAPDTLRELIEQLVADQVSSV
jgi:hypothetical protein